ncbi:hypothetical protein BOH78_5343 [Pichia kudriavzevii]|uniref:Uncharacterized protein n=1 Tax=Pichia kudriavzevii TaxID=4909 RepID=A0A1V2LEM7_PICKU|nr:hypothetical protein BOH78_5343 [Pichia kudriavzevii]
MTARQETLRIIVFQSLLDLKLLYPLIRKQLHIELN